jgi:hypothetical protein
MNRHCRAASRKRLQFERLESRHLMAGNVTAELIDGTLYLTGDDAANGIAIVGTETPGEVIVTGTPAFAGDVTELNQQDGPLTFIVTKDIVIRTGAGNDGVELNNVGVPRNLSIETGDGLDRVAIGYCTVNAAVNVVWPPATENVPGGVIYDPQSFSSGNDRIAVIIEPIYKPLNWTVGTVGVGRDLSISTGDSADYVFLGHTHIGRNLALRTEDGQDNFIVHTVSALNFDAGTGRDADLANITGLSTRGQMTLETGFGNDFVSYAASHAHGAATFLGGHGNNQVFVGTSVFSSSLYAEFGVDHDRLVIKSSMLLGNSTFFTGQGADRIDINYTFGRFVSANTGEQGDSLNIVGSALDNIYAALGDGDDQMSVVVSRILYPLIADGGTGAGDIMHEYGNAAYYIALPGIEHTNHAWPWWLM